MVKKKREENGQKFNPREGGMIIMICSWLKTGKNVDVFSAPKLFKILKNFCYRLLEFFWNCDFSTISTYLNQFCLLGTSIVLSILSLYEIQTSGMPLLLNCFFFWYPVFQKLEKSKVKTNIFVYLDKCFCNFDKYISKFWLFSHWFTSRSSSAGILNEIGRWKQIYLTIWTNIVCNFDKYISKFGQIKKGWPGAAVEVGSRMKCKGDNLAIDFSN